MIRFISLCPIPGRKTDHPCESSGRPAYINAKNSRSGK
jgi:hypothetical protein